MADSLHSMVANFALIPDTWPKAKFAALGVLLKHFADRIEPDSSTEQPQPEATETAWLIEWPLNDNLPARWWHPERGWMLDANKAIRYARKEDAEAAIKDGRFGGMIATEHQWVALAPEATSK